MSKKALLEILLKNGALAFGEFKTKAGRNSPYFVNFGSVASAGSLQALGDLYAAAIDAALGKEVDNIFGPAYKGIPLAIATASGLSRRQGRDVRFTFDRKEAKDHGEGGSLIGHPYQAGERVVIVDDVLSAGTSARHSLELLQKTPAKVVALCVALDREERGTGTAPARQEIEAKFQIPVISILSVTEMLAELHNKYFLGKTWIDDRLQQAIVNYLRHPL